jgi:NAD-dependent deacetylase
LVWQFYDWRRRLIAGCEPNPAHYTLVEMEQTFEDFTLITQNVDGLHQRAGSRRIVTLHGDIWQVRCIREGTVTRNEEVPLPVIPPRCSCGALLRPDVVWFGEPLKAEDLATAWEAATRCHLMLVVGTSAVVEPAASLPLLAKRTGARVVEFNLEETPVSAYADEVVLGPAGQTLPEWWGRWRGQLA